MSNIIEFKSREQRKEADVTQKLVLIADEIDAVILKHMNDPEMDPRELVGVLSHRLGTLMNHLEEKDELWFLCQKVMKRQAHIEG